MSASVIIVEKDKKTGEIDKYKSNSHINCDASFAYNVNLLLRAIFAVTRNCAICLKHA